MRQGSLATARDLSSPLDPFIEGVFQRTAQSGHDSILRTSRNGQMKLKVQLREPLRGDTKDLMHFVYYIAQVSQFLVGGLPSTKRSQPCFQEHTRFK
jgi:hypothetical protein